MKLTRLLKKFKEFNDKGIFNFYMGFILALEALFTFDGFDWWFYMAIPLILINWYYGFGLNKRRKKSK